MKGIDAKGGGTPEDWDERRDSLSGAGFDVAALSHRGRVRKNNQDRFLVRLFDEGSVLLALADGLGGDSAGALAAETVRERLYRVSPPDSGREQEQLRNLAGTLDAEILGLSKTKTRLRGMGSTLVLVLIRKERAHWLHIGDSRLYLFRSPRLIQVTRDQTLARFLVEEKELSPDEARSHYSRRVMDQYVGCGFCAPESGEFEIQAGDVLMLTSDGVHGQMEAEEILGILLAPGTLRDKCEDLAKTPLNKGGRDNLTVVLASRQE